MEQENKKQDGNPSVQDIFDAFLEEKGLRKTQERLAVLEEIYKDTGHFDADSLYLNMKQKNFRVSRATVYNTLELLLQCNLVTKHQFGSNLSLYEKSYNYRQHDHLICIKCNKILEFCDPRLQVIQNTVSDIYDFDIQTHSLQFYGECKDEKCKTKVS